LEYAPSQLFSSISYELSTVLRRVYNKWQKPTPMAKTAKMTKLASIDAPHQTVSGSEGLIHINLHNEVITGYKEGIKVFKGSCYC
jgi:hypothetical protein